MDRRTFLATAAAASMAPVVHAEDAVPPPVPELYAALSLIGDSFSVVTHRATIRSSLDTNRRESVPVTDGALDKLALIDVGTALKRSLPNSSVAGLLANEPGLFANQNALFSDAKLLLPDDLAQAVKDTKAGRLILLTKYRNDSWLKARHGSLGSGKLEGLGFYVDRWEKMKRSDTGEEGHGFIAPYVYVRVWLIDVPSFTVLGSQEIMAGRTVAAAHNEEGFDPWGALSDAQKIGHIQHLMSQELDRVIPLLLTPPQAVGTSPTSTTADTTSATAGSGL